MVLRRSCALLLCALAACAAPEPDSLPQDDAAQRVELDVIYEKWGRCYDVDFNKVDSFGFKSLYLNVLPFHLGGRRWNGQRATCAAPGYR